MKAGHLPAGGPLQSPAMALEHATAHLGHSWSDHPGLLRFGEYDLLAAEPYAACINHYMTSELENFVRLFGGDYCFTAASGHFPGQTVRIVVADSSKVITAFRNAEHARLNRIARTKYVAVNAGNE